MSESITNREALREKIHEIHNYIRNHGAGYGMNGLKLFNVLYGLKKIEEKGLLDKTRLKRPECEFSYLLHLATTGEDEKLSTTILKDVLDSLYESDLKGFLYYDLSRHLKSSIFAYLINEIEQITRIEETCNVLLSGKIYEYFVGRDESAISELGAYFTDRHIVNYILDKLDPVVEDGEVPSMVDMFGGSGGFTTGYIDYLQKKAEEKDEPIEWETQLKQVSHYDMNEDVVKSAGLEFFCLTGVLPNPKQLFYKNSFTDNFEDDQGLRKYHYVLTNPPYGGDKNTKSAAQEKRDKVKAFLKSDVVDDEEVRQRRKAQLKRIETEEKSDKKRNDQSHVSVSSSSMRIQKFAKDRGLKGNDKESCSLMLMMDMVEVGGTSIGVLKEGVFFNKTYKDLRRCLVEHYNVREVISVPQDQFENTSTKTSIVIFDNTEVKTSEVVFRDLVVERYEEDTFAEDEKGNIVLGESKDDICGVSDMIVSSATRAELLASPICSLNGKDYSKKEIVVGEGYELVKLGDICKIVCGKALPKNKAVQGPYNVYGGGSSSYTHNEYTVEGFNILLSRVGTNNITLTNEKLYITDNGFSLKIKNESTKKIIGYYLFGNKERIFTLGNGSAQKVITKTQLNKLQIPIPKSPAKIQAWVDKISDPHRAKMEKQIQIKELETIVQEHIRTMTDFDEVELGSVCEINPETLKNKQFGHISYIDIGSVKEETIQNVQVIHDKFPSRAKRIIRKNDIIVSTVRPNLKGYAMVVSEIENSVASSGFAVLRTTKIHPRFIYNAIKDDKTTEYLMLNCTGTKYPAVNPSVFEKIIIRIPKNKQFIKSLETTFMQIEQLHQEVNQADALYQQYIRELSAEAIP